MRLGWVVICRNQKAPIYIHNNKTKKHEVQDRTGAPSVRLLLLFNCAVPSLLLNQATPLARARNQGRRSALRGEWNSHGHSIYGPALEAVSRRAAVVCVFPWCALAADGFLSCAPAICLVPFRLFYVPPSRYLLPAYHDLITIFGSGRKLYLCGSHFIRL